MATHRSTNGSQPTPPPALDAGNGPAAAADGLASEAGCYLIRLDPVVAPGGASDMHYDGTLRISAADDTLAVSGDLYVHLNAAGQPASEPDPAAGIPILPRDDYRTYIRGVGLRRIAGEDALDFEFELHDFDRATGTWSDEGPRQARLRRMTNKKGVAIPATLVGDVRTTAGEVVGHLHAVRVSRHLRRATVEIDRVPTMERPLGNGAGVTWKKVFSSVGWDMTIERGDSDVAEPSADPWTDAELHQTMLERRRSADLDAEWRFHVLCVRMLQSTPRGLMYDTAASDSDHVPREGIGIGTGWIPETAEWGPLVGKRFGTATSPYFRTALHEIGHAMGLQHNIADFGVMNTTDVLALRATNPKFPDNALWSFAADDRHRLRHLPDPWVRPGGIPFGQAFSTAPIADEASRPRAGVQLELEALLEVVPFGAPVRVEYRLTNRGRRAAEVPASLNVRDGAVSGRVVDPAGVVRTFKPLLRCIDSDATRDLEPNGSMSHAVTLLRGGEGALFPTVGVHQIQLDVAWRTASGPVVLTARTSIIVTGPESRDHARAAHRMLSVPDAMLTLVLGGDHLKDGVDTIHQALDCQQLNEHVAWIEAKRLAVPFFERRARLEDAVGLLDEATVMSQAEIARAADIVRQARPKVLAAVGAGAGAVADAADAADVADAGIASADGIACEKLTKLLQVKAQRPSVADAVRTEVAAL